MKKFQHYIVTRFNVGLYFGRSEVSAREWMDDRLRLFEKYCVPSVMTQTCQDFKWIIILDRYTPQHRIRDVKFLAPKSHIYHSKWPETKFHERKSEQGTWKQSFVSEIQGKSEYAVMTRLDNDDALNVNFVKYVQDALLSVKEPHNTIVDFLDGCFYDEKTGKCHLCRHSTGSPFITFVSKVEPAMDTVYRTSHREMCIHLKNKPRYIAHDYPNQVIWVEVIHGNNKANYVIPEMVVGEYDWNTLKGQFGL
jgi:hypothetical protein